MEECSIRILLIEDNPGDARLVKEMLAEGDPGSFYLSHAERLSEGLTRLKEDDFQVVLLDLSLPDAQGLDTVSQVCAQAPHVPAVVLTGLDDETLAIRAVQEGAQDYLVKGQMDYHLLKKSIRYGIERKRAEAIPFPIASNFFSSTFRRAIRDGKTSSPTRLGRWLVFFCTNCSENARWTG